MQNSVWDCSMADYPRLEHETSDEGRIRRAVRDCAGGVLFFPRVENVNVFRLAELIKRVVNCASGLVFLRSGYRVVFYIGNKSAGL